MKLKTLTLAGLFLLFIAHNLPAASSAPAEDMTAVKNTTTAPAAPGGIPMQDIQLNATDFKGGVGSGFVVTDQGLTMDVDAVTAVYTSPIIQSDIPFNALVPKWLADVPEMAGMELLIRSKTAGGGWSQWFGIQENDDFKEPSDSGLVGDMLIVPYPETTHQEIQISVSFGRYKGIAAPLLRQLTLTVIDSTAGPTTEEMLAQQAVLDAARPNSGAANGATPRPTVISRDVWCTSVDCDYTAGLEYTPATHMTVHHTVSSNEHTDWAPIVRAIWSYHTYGNGWGDIGYNYLIDRTGVIYEGHMNEDYLNLDVIGTHAAIANAGSMGVSLIGTFTTFEEYPSYYYLNTPPQVMLDAATDLMAWKADQRNIDVYSASRLINMDWGLPHIMGHRDVYGGLSTLCPGGNAYALLPYLRDQVAQRINFVSPYIYVDELSDAFTKSASTWHEGPRGCGNNGHSYYTKNVNDPALIDNWGEWRPDVPENGRYEIEVYAPYCNIGGPETDGAIYTVTGADGPITSTVSHQANVGLWMSLGAFNLDAGTGNLIRLTDLTVNDPTNYDYAVWFDAIRLRPLEAAATNTTPAPDAWLNQTAVDFAWEIANPSSVLTTTLQAATDAGFSDMVYTESWATAVPTVTHIFSQEYADLYWRIRLDTSFNNQVYSTATRFGIDTTLPASSVNAINSYPDGHYELFWQGADNLSGIAGYTIEYRADGDVGWTTYLTNTMVATTEFTSPVPGQLYWFRSQTTDHAGNSEPAHTGAGDINTDQATPAYTMAVSNQSPAADVWLSDPAVTFTWVLTDAEAISAMAWTAATDGAFTHVVAEQTWNTAVTNTLHTFTQDYADLYWQVTLTNTANARVYSTPTQFSLDTTPPATAVISLTDHVMAQNYDLVWEGSDTLSGIAGYNIEYRADGDVSWTRLMTNTTLTTTQFSPANYNQTYWFRSQGVDALGNLEAPHSGDGDINTDQATLIFNPSVTGQSPPAGPLVGGSPVLFSWTLTDVTNPLTSTVQVATDSAFTTLVAEETVIGGATSANLAFSQDYATLYWRVTVEFTPPKPGLINAVTSLAANFSLDVLPPTSQITTIFEIPSTGYVVKWAGSDALSGVAAYTIEYRALGETIWTRLVEGTTAVSAVFIPPNPGQTYEFRSQATDLVGNVEAPQNAPYFNTDQAILLSHAIMLPIVAKN